MTSDNGETVMQPPLPIEEVLKNKPQNFEMAKKAKKGRYQCFYDCGKFFNSEEEAKAHQRCAMRKIDEERWNRIKEEHEEWSSPSSGSLGSTGSDSIEKKKFTYDRGNTLIGAKDSSEGSHEHDVPGSFERFLNTLPDWGKDIQWEMNWRRFYPNGRNPYCK